MAHKYQKVIENHTITRNQVCTQWKSGHYSSKNTENPFQAKDKGQKFDNEMHSLPSHQIWVCVCTPLCPLNALRTTCPCVLIWLYRILPVWRRTDISPYLKYFCIKNTMSGQHVPLMYVKEKSLYECSHTYWFDCSKKSCFRELLI